MGINNEIIQIATNNQITNLQSQINISNNKIGEKWNYIYRTTSITLTADDFTNSNSKYSCNKIIYTLPTYTKFRIISCIVTQSNIYDYAGVYNIDIAGIYSSYRNQTIRRFMPIVFNSYNIGCGGIVESSNSSNQLSVLGNIYNQNTIVFRGSNATEITTGSMSLSISALYI